MPIQDFKHMSNPSEPMDTPEEDYADHVLVIDDENGNKTLAVETRSGKRYLVHNTPATLGGQNVVLTTLEPDGLGRYINYQEQQRHFYPMDVLPKQSKADPNYSPSVIIYAASDDHFFDIGFYNFEDKKWWHFGDTEYDMICWCYAPHPGAWKRQFRPTPVPGPIFHPEEGRKDIDLYPES